MRSSKKDVMRAIARMTGQAAGHIIVQIICASILRVVMNICMEAYTVVTIHATRMAVWKWSIQQESIARSITCLEALGKSEQLPDVIAFRSMAER